MNSFEFFGGRETKRFLSHFKLNHVPKERRKCFSMVFGTTCQFLLHVCFTVYFYRHREFAENSCGDISRQIPMASWF